MPNLVSLLALVRALGPAIYLVAAAYRFGCKKHGDGTWRQITPHEHITRAASDLQTVTSEGGKSQGGMLLINTILRLSFAATLLISNGLIPKRYKQKDKK